jgi:uncharacterized integral membrane protein
MAFVCSRSFLIKVLYFNFLAYILKDNFEECLEVQTSVLLLVFEFDGKGIWKKRRDVEDPLLELLNQLIKTIV